MKYALNVSSYLFYRANPGIECFSYPIFLLCIVLALICHQICTCMSVYQLFQVSVEAVPAQIRHVKYVTFKTCRSSWPAWEPWEVKYHFKITIWFLYECIIFSALQIFINILYGLIGMLSTRSLLISLQPVALQPFALQRVIIVNQRHQCHRGIYIRISVTKKYRILKEIPC